MSLRRLTLVVLLAIASGVSAGHGAAAGPAMTLGVAEDAVRAPDLPTAEAKMAQLRLAGFTAVRVTTNWEPGLVAPAADELRELRNVETAADLNGVTWTKSSYSDAIGNCVEFAVLDGGEIAMRNSRFPEGPALVYTRAEMAAFVAGARDGEFDDLVD